MVQILTDHGAGCNFNVFVDDGAANGATFADSHIPSSTDSLMWLQGPMLQRNPSMDRWIWLP